MDSITFKNSAIIQEKKGKKSFGIKINKIKESEKTSQFLKNISFANLGISVYYVNGLYNVVLGGTKDYITDKGLIITSILAGGAPSSSFSNSYTHTYFNATFNNYYYYKGTKSTFINCLFDQNLKHVSGQAPLNTFDLINDFEDTLDKPRAVNIFTHQGDLYYNYLDKEHGTFQLFNFEE